LKEFLTIEEVADYLQIKKSTLYSKVEKGEIPHYKIGHLVRFRQEEIDAWTEKFKSEPLRFKGKAKDMVRSADGRTTDIDEIVKRAVASSQRMKYIPKYKGDRTRIRDLRKEVEDGTL
jgi:excisionase family DNA binding protein